MWKPPQRIRHEASRGRVPSREEARSSRLFSPVAVGTTSLEQRTWVPAMVPWRATDEGFVTDDIVDRFGIVGDVEAHIAKLRALAEAGVDQFNLYLMNGNEEEQLAIYGRSVIPALRDIPAA